MDIKELVRQDLHDAGFSQSKLLEVLNIDAVGTTLEFDLKLEGWDTTYIMVVPQKDLLSECLQDLVVKTNQKLKEN